MIINPIWFYLSQLSNDAKYSAILVIFASIFVCVFAFINISDFYYDRDKQIPILKKIFKCEAVLILVCLITAIIFPSNKTCYQMIVASQVTEDNLKTVEKTIKSSVDYIFEKMDK